MPQADESDEIGESVPVMDYYPAELSPLSEDHETKTPFAEWWAEVEASFPTVPVDVAEQWLHRHWGNSPYGYLKSRDYGFELQRWPADRLAKIRTNQTDYAADNEPERAHGLWLCDVDSRRYPYWLADFMVAEHDFPVPIIVLDNRDGHIPAKPKRGSFPRRAVLPPEFILIEGHKRFAIALYLISIDAFAPSFDLWLMRRLG